MKDLLGPKVMTQIEASEIALKHLTGALGIAPNKFAPVVPHHFYRQFLLNEYVPNSILLLAHDVVANKEEYEELFQDSSWDHTTIFMDNSLVELKKAVDVSMVQEAVDIIGGPSENVIVILPDAMADSAATIKLTKDAYDDWAWKFRKCQLLGVIQGATMAEFLTCAEEFETLNLDWVSIPRVTESRFGYHRRELVPLINALMPDNKIHLLGFSDYIWEDLMAAAHPAVKSIDSAVPFRMESFNVLSENIGPRGDWWENAKFDMKMLDNIQEINRLINGLAFSFKR